MRPPALLKQRSAMEYEAVIGLEVHVQLATATKMFTRIPYRYGDLPNSLTNPVVMGLPGSLPVMNRRAVGQTITVGLLFGCEIAEVCKWDRKNYFYPDQPKNYQISQYDQPVCCGGSVEIELPGPTRNVMGKHRNVRLTRIHLEEDVGKLTHEETTSLVDLNRAGAPLIEIVSEPDIHTADEAHAFLTSLRMHMIHSGISDCDMEKGQLRCDANVSVRPTGSGRLGTKVEIKNMNSFSGVRNGVSYEIDRQVRRLAGGEAILQETRGWNAHTDRTYSLRSKEYSHDYRYFPDPDLMPVRISRSWVTELRSSLPELPFDRQRRWIRQYNLPFTLTSALCPEPDLCRFFEAAVELSAGDPQRVANLVANDIRRAVATGGGGSLASYPIHPAHLAELVDLIAEGVISKQIAQDLVGEIVQTGEKPGNLVERRGLRQSTDRGEIEAICTRVVEENPRPVQEFRSGNEKAINALKGQVMRATRGKANPQLVDRILRKQLS